MALVENDDDPELAEAFAEEVDDKEDIDEAKDLESKRQQQTRQEKNKNRRHSSFTPIRASFARQKKSKVSTPTGEEGPGSATTSGNRRRSSMWKDITTLSFLKMSNSIDEEDLIDDDEEEENQEDIEIVSSQTSPNDHVDLTNQSNAILTMGSIDEDEEEIESSHHYDDNENEQAMIIMQKAISLGVTHPMMIDEIDSSSSSSSNDCEDPSSSSDIEHTVHGNTADVPNSASLLLSTVADADAATTTAITAISNSLPTTLNEPALFSPPAVAHVDNNEGRLDLPGASGQGEEREEEDVMRFYWEDDDY